MVGQNPVLYRTPRAWVYKCNLLSGVCMGWGGVAKGEVFFLWRNQSQLHEFVSKTYKFAGGT